MTTLEPCSTCTVARTSRSPGRRSRPGSISALSRDPTRQCRPSEAHRLLHQNQPAGTVAVRLGITLDHLRYVIRRYPTPPKPQTASQRRIMRHPIPSHLTGAHLRNLIDNGDTIRSIAVETGVTRRTIRAQLSDTTSPSRTQDGTLTTASTPNGSATNISSSVARCPISPLKPTRRRPPSPGSPVHTAYLSAPRRRESPERAHRQPRLSPPVAPSIAGHKDIGRVHRFQIDGNMPSFSTARSTPDLMSTSSSRS